jgi:hypothetical protein
LELIEVAIYEPELLCVEMLRVALSEETLEARLRAIENVKYDVRTSAAESLFSGKRQVNDDPRYIASLHQIAKTSGRSYEAAYELAQTTQRFETKNERKLNIAEHIGNVVLLSIYTKKFQGVQTDDGILTQVQCDARKHNIYGGKNHDTLRDIWRTYRGVVHLGMAMAYCEDNPNADVNVLHLAEEYRRALSENCPKKAVDPYVDSSLQIKFTYKTRY